MIIDPFVLGLLAIFLLVALPCAWATCRGPTQKLLLIPTILGFTLYNGFAISTVDAPPYMRLGYFIFIVVLIAGFRFGARLATPLGKTIGLNATNVLADYAEGHAARWMIMIYFAVIGITLVLPTFKLHLLLAPPLPDLRASFASRFTESREMTGGLIGIFAALVTPLYYFALYRYRTQTVLLSLLLLAPLYMIYVRDAYIARNSVLLMLTYLFMITWTFRPELRFALLIVSMIMLPILGGIAYDYTFTRMGASSNSSGLLEGLLLSFEDETMLPIDIGVPLVESGYKADLEGYFTWLITLPFPYFLKDGLPTIQLNYDISEIVLGIRRGMPGFYVVLPGLLAESMYLFGRILFVLHPLMIGAVIGVFATILQNIPRNQGLVYFLSFMMFFNLNRGGVAAIMPLLINSFLLFWLIVFLGHLIGRRRRKLLAMRHRSDV